MDDHRDAGITVRGPVIEWRGPAPFYFVEMPEEESADLKEMAKGIEYWGQVPVDVRIDGVGFFTALFPKDGIYLIPLKVAVRREIGVGPGDVITAEVAVRRRDV